MIPKRWMRNNIDPSRVAQLAAEHGLSNIAAGILLNRGITDSLAVKNFLHPSLANLFDPCLLDGMDAAVIRLVAAVKAKEKMIIYGDYDVDGTTSTALMVDFLQKLGANVDYYIPNRATEGYSLNEQALEQLSQRGTALIITVDNGIKALIESEHAHKLGIDLIITDHHELGAALPLACAVINPKRNLAGPGQELAGVGVAFFLLLALRKKLREQNYFIDRVEPNLKDYLDLVCIGTIADMCPLIGANRILCKMGLEVLSKTGRAGLKALLKVSKIIGKVSTGQVGFRLGPRINAVGRLSDASFGVKLLLTTELKIATQLAMQLDNENENRKVLEQQICEHVFKGIEKDQLMLTHKSIVLAGSDYHAGVVGIVASRVVERYHLPTIILAADGEFYKGSARSIRGLNIVAALEACSKWLHKYGGHAFAAGLTLRKEFLAAFYRDFDEYVKNTLTKPEDFQPVLKIDVQATFADINRHLVAELKNLGPFGQGNPEPVLELDAVQINDTKIVGEKHLKGNVKLGEEKLAFIGFGMAQRDFSLTNQNNIAFSPELNEFNGNSQIQLVLKDISPILKNNAKR